MTQVSRDDALDRLRTEVQKLFQGGFAKLMPWPPNAKFVSGGRSSAWFIPERLIASVFFEGQNVLGPFS
jgi:hypothetical protein